MIPYFLKHANNMIDSRYNWNIVESGVKHHQTNKQVNKRRLPSSSLGYERCEKSLQWFLCNEKRVRYFNQVKFEVLVYNMYKYSTVYDISEDRSYYLHVLKNKVSLVEYDIITFPQHLSSSAAPEFIPSF
jgi:hypothetical protein